MSHISRVLDAYRAKQQGAEDFTLGRTQTPPPDNGVRPLNYSDIPGSFAATQENRAATQQSPKPRARLTATQAPILRRGGTLAGIFGWHGDMPAHATDAYISRYKDGRTFWGGTRTVVEAMLMSIGGLAGVSAKGIAAGYKTYQQGADVARLYHLTQLEGKLTKAIRRAKRTSAPYTIKAEQFIIGPRGTINSTEDLAKDFVRHDLLKEFLSIRLSQTQRQLAVVRNRVNP